MEDVLNLVGTCSKVSKAETGGFFGDRDEGMGIRVYVLGDLVI